MDIAQLVEQYGLPIAMAGGMGYFIFFIWKFVTTQIKPKLGATFTVLVALIDRIRMLDNDLIRLQSKVDTVITYKEQVEILEDAEEKKALEQENQRLKERKQEALAAHKTKEKFIQLNEQEIAEQARQVQYQEELEQEEFRNVVVS